MLCWLLSIFFPLLSPIIFMLVGKDRPFVYANAMQCLTMDLLWWIGGTIIAVITCGIGSIIFIVPLIFSIMGTIRANNAEIYEPPITGPLAKKWFNV